MTKGTQSRDKTAEIKHLKFEFEMEHYLKQFDKELMKKAMLKHEKTFRQQVYELHRLYRLQKQLMREVRCTKELKRQRDSTFSRPPNQHNRTCQIIDLQLPAEKYIVNTTDDHEEQLLELTLAIGCPKKKRGGSSPASNSNDSFFSSIEYSGPAVNHEMVPHYNATDRLYHAVTRRDKEYALVRTMFEPQNDMIGIVYSSTC